MTRVKAKRETPGETAGVQRSGLSIHAIAAFLIKVAKHMALLSSFMIVGNATDRSTIGELAIFFLIAVSALVYSVGRSLGRRGPARVRLPLSEP